MYKDYKDIFDRRANLYQNAMMLAPKARDREFQLVVNYLALSGKERVLDMPAGGGYLQSYLSDSHSDLYCMETSLAFACYCRSNFTAHSLLGSFSQLPVKNDGMDRVISLAALHHVEEREQFFRECHRVLSPSGLMVIADVEEDTQTANFLNVFVNQYNTMGHEGKFLSNREPELLSNCGFHANHDELHEFQWHFSSEQEMLDYCRGLFGIDLASDATLKSGIEQYLEPIYNEESVSLRWQLRYITLTMN